MAAALSGSALLVLGWVYSGPNRRANAACWSWSRCWSRKKTTLYSRMAALIWSRSASLSGRLRSTPLISAPIVGWSGRMVRVPSWTTCSVTAVIATPNVY